MGKLKMKARAGASLLPTAGTPTRRPQDPAVTKNCQTPDNDNWGDRTATKGSNDRSSKGVCNAGREWFLPTLIILTFPMLIFAMAARGSFGRLEFSDLESAPYVLFRWCCGLVDDTWGQIEWHDVRLVMGYAAFQLLLMRVMPGGIHKGPKTSTGHVPMYKANGTACHLTTLATLAAIHYYGFYDIALVYERFAPITGVISIFGMGLSFLCMIKGLYWPSTEDSGSCSSWALNYYFGTELYPRVFGWDIKQFSNCRFGMMSWAPLCLMYMAAQYKNVGFVANTMWVSVALQVIYCTKFFHWETGYFNSTDLTTDRAGFYLVYGCMAIVPVLYTAASRELVNNPVQLPDHIAYALFLFGCLCIYVNYWADEQRASFRKTGGKEKIWGKIPEKIEATYVTSDGKRHISLLLCSGFWAMSRHFHYIPEWLAAVCWSIPMGSGTLLQYAYVAFLFILLVDRAYRDEDRCLKKYGKYWVEYCEKVPYRIVPYVF